MKQQYSFLLFVVILIIIAICFVNYENTSLRNSHLRIVEAHENSIAEQNRILDSVHTLLKDTTYSAPSKETISLLSDIARTLNSNEIEKTTTHLLELEFNKLQNEYVGINIWCGLLTVVFLIFSFYSFFKTNEMTEKGEKSYEQIKAIENEINQKPKQLDKKVEEAEKNLNNQVSQIQTKASEKLKSIREQISERQKELNSIQTQANVVQSNLNNFEREINNKKIELQNFVDEKQNQIDENFENLTKSVQDGIKQSILNEIQNLRTTVNILQGDIKALTQSLEFEEFLNESMLSIEDPEDETDREPENNPDEENSTPAKDS